MIFPFLNGLVSLRRAPTTWILFFLCTFVMVATHDIVTESQKSLESILHDDYFRDTQGRLFAQFIRDNPKDFSPLMGQMARDVAGGDSEKLALLGGLAVRSGPFVNRAPSYAFKGDIVANEYWKNNFQILRGVQEVHPSYILGLSSEDLSFGKWITYQFVHSGFMHFFGNMIFLLLFGCILEPLIGSLSFLLVFLGSGVLAAAAFIFMTGATVAPLVGASGAVSGVMALFAFIYWGQAVRYVYWLFLPFKGYSGYVYLPAWTILLIWAGSDLAGYFGNIDELGGVAYTAHLGGEITGVFFGTLIYFLKFRKPRYLDGLPENVQMGQLLPFADLYRRSNS